MCSIQSSVESMVISIDRTALLKSTLAQLGFDVEVYFHSLCVIGTDYYCSAFVQVHAVLRMYCNSKVDNSETQKVLSEEMQLVCFSMLRIAFVIFVAAQEAIVAFAAFSAPVADCWSAVLFFLEGIVPLSLLFGALNPQKVAF